MLGERVIGGDDHGAGVGVERRRCLLAEDSGGAAVSGEDVLEAGGQRRHREATWPRKATATAWLMTS